MYLTYAEYKAMGGELDTTEFTRLEYKARMEIDLVTFNRLKEVDIPEEVKKCIYELVETENNTNDILSSESVDGYSVTYKSSEDTEKKKQDIIETYLAGCIVDGVPCLYRGV